MTEPGAAFRRRTPALRALVLGVITLASASVGADPVARAEAPAQPEVYALGDLRLQDPWAKGAIGVHEAKLFFAFRNLGAPDRLVAATATVASGDSKFHLVSRVGEKRTLQALEHIPIPTTKTPFELTEVGYYIEITRLNVPLVMGKEFSVTLRFEKAGSIEVPFRSRFHSPSLGRRIREAVESGDLEALKALRDK